MMSYRERLKEARSSDSGDATLITSLFLLPFVFFFLISSIDVGLYFMNESTLNAAARDGAGVVATLGGTNNTSINAYYENLPGDAEVPLEGITYNNAAERVVVQELTESSSLWRVILEDVHCYVEGESSTTQVTEIGDRPVCEITWTYDGVPLSAWGLLTSGNERVVHGSATSDLLVRG